MNSEFSKVTGCQLKISCTTEKSFILATNMDAENEDIVPLTMAHKMNAEV